MKPKILTAIFVTNKGTQSEKWYKYRKISSSDHSIQKFVKFAETKGANEINFYNSISGDFWAKITPGR